MVSEHIKKELIEIAKKAGKTPEELKNEFMEIYNNSLLQNKSESFRETFAFGQIKTKYRNVISQKIKTVISKVIKVSENTYTKDNVEHTRIQTVGVGHLEDEQNMIIINTIFIDKDVTFEEGKTYKYNVSSYGKPANGIYTAFGVDNEIISINEDIDEHKVIESLETQTLAEIFEELEEKQKWSGLFKAVVTSTNISTSAKTGREFGIMSVTDDSLDSIFVSSAGFAELTGFINPEDITFAEGAYILALADAQLTDRTSAFGPTLNIRWVNVLFDMNKIDQNPDIPMDHDDEFW